MTSAKERLMEMSSSLLEMKNDLEKLPGSDWTSAAEILSGFICNDLFVTQQKLNGLINMMKGGSE